MDTERLANLDLGPIKTHFCPFDPDCKNIAAMMGPIYRFHVFTRYGQLIVGPTRTQGWLPFIGYLPWKSRWSRFFWWPVAWHPTSEEERRQFWSAR